MRSRPSVQSGSIYGKLFMNTGIMIVETHPDGRRPLYRELMYLSRWIRTKSSATIKNGRFRLAGRRDDYWYHRGSFMDFHTLSNFIETVIPERQLKKC